MKLHIHLNKINLIMKEILTKIKIHKEKYYKLMIMHNINNPKFLEILNSVILLKILIYNKCPLQYYQQL